MSLQDFEFNLYDRTLKWKRPLTGLVDLNSTVIHNGAGVTTFRVSTRNPAMGILSQQGCRLGIQFRGKHLTSGLIRQQMGTTRKGRGPVLSGVQRFSMVDDWRVFQNVRAWPSPGKPVNQQGDDTAYYSIGPAPAETVLKDVFTKNVVERLGMAFTVEPNQARGGSVNIQFRMHPLADRLFPAVDLAGIGARILLPVAGGARRLEVYTPRTFPHILDEENRVIRDGDWNTDGPEITRGVVGGQGQGTLRHYETFRDAAREALWGEIIEGSVDARDTDQADAYAKRAAEALLEGAPKDSISLQLIETGSFVFGGAKGIQLGDRATARISGGAISITDVLREATLKWDQGNGLKIEATIGVKDDPTTPIQAAIAALGKALRDMKAGQ